VWEDVAEAGLPGTPPPCCCCCCCCCCCFCGCWALGMQPLSGALPLFPAAAAGAGVGTTPSEASPYAGGALSPVCLHAPCCAAAGVTQSPSPAAADGAPLMLLVPAAAGWRLLSVALPTAPPPCAAGILAFLFCCCCCCPVAAAVRPVIRDGPLGAAESGASQILSLAARFIPDMPLVDCTSSDCCCCCC
jgi:hypothetical protein